MEKSHSIPREREEKGKRGKGGDGRGRKNSKGKEDLCPCSQTKEKSEAIRRSFVLRRQTLVFEARGTIAS